MLAFSILLLSYHNYHAQNDSLAVFLQQNKHVAYAALPSTENVVDASASLTDRRVQSVQNFLASYNSPLLPYAQLIVDKADQYGIDYKWLPAIAAQESGLCKKMVPSAPFNCWGFGIYDKKRTGFSSFEEAIDTITRYFANKKNKGINSLEEIGAIYNPSNYNDWKGKVSYFMNQL